MDRTTDRDVISTRVLLWGVVAPLLVGGFVPLLGSIALLWLLGGLGTLMVQSIVTAIRGADPGEDDDLLAELDDDDLHDELAGGPTTPVPAVIGRWWNRPDEDPNTAAARAGSWG